MVIGVARDGRKNRIEEVEGLNTAGCRWQFSHDVKDGPSDIRYRVTHNFT